MDTMNNRENARLIIALRACGWSDTRINDLVLYMETGEEQWLNKVKTTEKE